MNSDFSSEKGMNGPISKGPRRLPGRGQVLPLMIPGGSEDPRVSVMGMAMTQHGCDMRYLEGEQEGYLTVYIRREFEVDDPASLKAFALQVDYDDGFIAFINGREVARANVSGSRVPHDQDAAGGHEAGSAETFWLDPATISLNAGRNVLAIQGHNYKIDSSDFTLIPELLEAPEMEGEPSIRRPLGIDELQHLLHVRGIYAKRQLQAVLGEFWENHFTTDYDKVVEYLEDMEDENGYGLSEEQAEAEAVHVEYEDANSFIEMP